MGEDSENNGRAKPGGGEERGGEASEAGVGGEAGPQASDAGLSEEERIGRSLDEVSDIIHNALSDSNDAGSGAGGDGAAPAGAGEEQGESAEVESTDSEVEAERRPEEPEPERRPEEPEPERRPEEAGAEPEPEPERRPEEAGAEEEMRQGKEPGDDRAAEREEAEASIEPGADRGDEDRIPNPVIESILGPSEASGYGEGGGRGGRTYSYDDFVDERILISRDAFGKKEMKIKVLEVSDEKAPTSWKLGDRVKVDKILVTVKHLETQQVEEGEFDIESIEKEIARDRHYSSTNRWVPTTDIKNGYVAGSRHTSLISDAVALDYITF